MRCPWRWDMGRIGIRYALSCYVILHYISPGTGHAVHDAISEQGTGLVLCVCTYDHYKHGYVCMTRALQFESTSRLLYRPQVALARDFFSRIIFRAAKYRDRISHQVCIRVDLGENSSNCATTPRGRPNLILKFRKKLFFHFLWHVFHDTSHLVLLTHFTIQRLLCVGGLGHHWFR